MIENIQQLENTQRKLADLELHYREREQDTPSHVRNLALQSLKRTINQLKKEIAVFEAHQHEGRAAGGSVKGTPVIEDEFQRDNTRNKLERLEELYEQEKQKEPSRARDATLRSLKKLNNQLTEEIAVFEAHQHEDRAKSVPHAECS